MDGGPFYYAQLRDTQLTNFKGLGGGITMFFRNNTKLNEKGDEDIHSKRFRLYGASISADGKDFYFATTAGTKSGFHEIFVSHFKNREWTYPQTLGSPINDSDYGNYAPFIAADGHTLFFLQTDQMAMVVMIFMFLSIRMDIGKSLLILVHLLIPLQTNLLFL